MDKISTMFIGVMILLGIIGFILVSSQKSTVEPLYQNKVSPVSTVDQHLTDKSPEIQITPQTIVSAKHAYQNGKHIFIGEVPLPTPCHILNSSIDVSSDNLKIFISLTSSIKEDQVCTQTITPARFKLSIGAKKNAITSIFLNDQEVVLNIIEASPDDNLDNFELYLKG